MHLDYQVPFRDAARFQWAMYKSINFLIPQRFSSIQRDIEMTNRPNVFSNHIIYFFPSLLYQSMSCSVHPSTDHIKLNQGGSRGAPYFPSDKCCCNCPMVTGRKNFNKMSNNISKWSQYLEFRNKKLWIGKILSTYFTAKDTFQDG